MSNIIDNILIQPQQPPPPIWSKIGLRGCDVVSVQGCWRSAATALQALCLVIDDKGSAFTLGPARNRCWCHQQSHLIFSIRPVIACHGSNVHWWPQWNVPEALNTGHVMRHNWYYYLTCIWICYLNNGIPFAFTFGIKVNLDQISICKLATSMPLSRSVSTCSFCQACLS